MTIQRKKRKASTRLRKLVLFLGIVLLIGGIGTVIYSLKKSNISFFSMNPFQHRGIIVPIPTNSSQYNVEKLLTEKGFALSSPPVASDSAYLISLSDGTTVLFSQSKPFDSQVESLQIIQARLTIEGRRAKRIDLRFADPVVVY